MGGSCKMELLLVLRDGVWMLASKELEIPLAFEHELEEHEEGEEILGLLKRRWTTPRRVALRYDTRTREVQSYLCEAVQRASELSYLGKRGLRVMLK